MSKSLYCRIALALTLVTVAVLCSYVSAAGPELSLSRLVWDFGSIEQEQTKTQKIVITNSGDQPVKIEKIELPEGFSVEPSPDDTEIQPEKTLEVEFTFDSKGIVGRIQQYAYIFSSSSDEKKIVPFTIKGEVFEKGRARLRVTPRTWNFGTITVGKTERKTFACENVGTADLKIQKIRIYDSRFQVTRDIAKQTLEPGEKAEFDVSVTGKYQGRYDTDFYIKSNSAGSSFTKLSMKGQVASKPRGLVVSRDFSSITNNTLSRFEVARTDKEGKTEAVTVERNSTRSFPREAGVPPARVGPGDYTLTIKMAKPVIPTAKPAEKKPPAEKPSPAAPPEAEKKPAEEKPTGATISPGTTPAKPQEPEPSEKPEKKEEKKPEQLKEEKKISPAAPSEKKEPEKPPQEASSKAEKDKPSKEQAAAPSTEPVKPAAPEELPKEPAKKAPGAGE